MCFREIFDQTNVDSPFSRYIVVMSYIYSIILSYTHTLKYLDSEITAIWHGKVSHGIFHKKIYLCMYMYLYHSNPPYFPFFYRRKPYSLPCNSAKDW